MGNQKILIVEDSEDIQDGLKHLFMSEGYDVRCASNGQEALEILHKENELPHMILLDLSMPIMDGYTFRKRQVGDVRLSKIPVVIMSADSSQNADQVRATANGSLKKPVDIDYLLKLTQKLCEPQVTI